MVDVVNVRENQEFSPVVAGDFVHAGGETHVLNYDTNILSLDADEGRAPTEMTDRDDEYPEEAEDGDAVEVNFTQKFNFHGIFELLIVLIQP